MAKDILRDYGRDSSQPQRAPASNGGRLTPKDLDYKPPVGPKGIRDPQGPGLHGTNHGNAPGQGKH